MSSCCIDHVALILYQTFQHVHSLIAALTSCHILTLSFVSNPLLEGQQRGLRTILIMTIPTKSVILIMCLPLLRPLQKYIGQ
jgi:hypothetical protein